MFLLGGCAVGPDYKQPKTAMPANWSADLNGGLKATAPDASLLDRWWNVFNNPVLSDLIERACTANKDLRQAEARLREARAQRGMAVADLFPKISATGSASRTGTSKETGAGTTSNLYSNGFDASWELDLFGKKRRTVEAAAATLQASEEDLRDVLVSLLAEVALNYVEVRSYQTRLSLTEANLAAQGETHDIARWRCEAGLTTQLDVDQAKLSLEQTRSEIPTLRIALEQAKHRLAVLVGQPPGALKDLLAAPKSIPVTPLEVAVGVPADVLRRRPDVRRAERKLAAQTAQIGVAKAERYPDLKLIGSIGLESLAYSNLYTASARAFQVAANATWTLFDGGRIRNNIRLQTAKQEEALSLYEATILTALRDVENALVAYAEQQTRRRTLAEAAHAAQSASKLARDEYSSGIADFQRVLDSQRSLLQAQNQLAASEGEVSSNLIRLYKALGGGWTPLAPAPKQAQARQSGRTP
jgi:NodT family efflux transporter outer membrane factor (OMF) lipoprotein